MAEVKLDIVVNDDGTVKIKKVGDALEDSHKKAEFARASILSMSGALNQIGIGMLREIGAEMLRQVMNLPALIGRVGEYAGQLLKVNAAVGLGAQAQQVLARAGEDVGVSFETQTNAIRKMQVVLGKNPELLKSVGLEWDAIKNLKPEEQFEAIGNAVNGIENPLQRTSAAVAFFGKTGTEVLPLFSGAIGQAKEDVEKFALAMSEKTALSVDRLADNFELGGVALEGFVRQIVGAIANSEPFQLLVEGILDVLGYLARTFQDNQQAISNWVSQGVVFAMSVLEDLVRALGYVVDGFTGVKVIIAGTIKQFKDTAAAVVFLSEVSMSPIAATKKLMASLESNAREMQSSVSAAMLQNAQWRAKIEGAATAVGTLKDKMVASSGETAKATETTKKLTTEYDKNAASASKTGDAAMKAAEQSRKAWDNFYESMKKRRDEDVAALTKNRITAMKDLDAMAKDTLNTLEETNSAMYGYVGDFVNVVEIEIKTALDLLDEWAAKWHAIAQVVGVFGESLSELGFSIGRNVQAIADGIDAGTVYAKAYKEAALANDKFGKAAAVATTAAYALKNGALAGAAAGAQLGFQMGGPVGAGIGAAAGALLGWIGKAARAREEARKLAEEVNRTRTAYIQSAGGLDVLALKAKQVGLSLDRLFNAKTVKDYQTAVEELNAAFDMRAKAQEELNALMDKYGLTIADLGPKFAQQKLDEMALTLIHDWELLNSVVADHNVALEKIAPEMSKYVQQVIAAGGTIPENLRPVIQALIDQGLLLDANGDKIEDISKLNFTKSLDDQVQSLIKSIKELINALLGIPPKVQTDVYYNEHRSQYQDPGEYGGDGGRSGDGYAMGGIVNAPITGARVTVHGNEAITPLTDLFGKFADVVAAKLSNVSVNGGGVRDIYVQMPDGAFARGIERGQKRGTIRLLPTAISKY